MNTTIHTSFSPKLCTIFELNNSTYIVYLGTHSQQKLHYLLQKLLNIQHLHEGHDL